MRVGRKNEGRSVPEKPEDKIWRGEFEKLTLADHDNKLAQLGLNAGDIEEFNEKFRDKRKN